MGRAADALSVSSISSAWRRHCRCVLQANLLAHPRESPAVPRSQSRLLPVHDCPVAAAGLGRETVHAGAAGFCEKRPVCASPEKQTLARAPRTERGLCAPRNRYSFFVPSQPLPPHALDVSMQQQLPARRKTAVHPAGAQEKRTTLPATVCWTVWASFDRQ
eukprot:COSAG06_NODE_26498_length_613_cov_1.404669_1_plen_160_part_01